MSSTLVISMPPAKRTPSPTLPRLQRFLSECGVASRRSAEELITAGKVSINGVIVTELGTRVDPEHAIVRVSNRIVKPAPKGVLLLHKPTGVVSTLSDPEGRRSIADYLTKHYRSYFPVGRLDWDSSGLVILTNDGDLANHLLHPRYGIDRVYHARVEGIPNQKTLDLLAKGVRLPDGRAACHAEILETADNYSWVEVTLSEGRNRIVRRLLEFVGHPVEKLKRVAHGPCKLGTLRPGDVRRLTEKEYLRLKRGVMSGGKKREDTRVRENEPGREGPRDSARRTGRRDNMPGRPRTSTTTRYRVTARPTSRAHRPGANTERRRQETRGDGERQERQVRQGRRDRKTPVGGQARSSRPNPSSVNPGRGRGRSQRTS